MTGSGSISVTVDFDVFFDSNTFFDEELENAAPVVTLQLNDLSILSLSLDATIAGPSLFEVFGELAHVEVLGQAAH